MVPESPQVRPFWKSGCSASPLILWAVTAPFQNHSVLWSPVSAEFLANKQSTENVVLGGAASSVRTSPVVPLTPGTRGSVPKHGWTRWSGQLLSKEIFEKTGRIAQVASNDLKPNMKFLQWLYFNIWNLGSATDCSGPFFSPSVNGDDKIPLTHNLYRNFRRKREPPEFTGQAPGVAGH